MRNTFKVLFFVNGSKEKDGIAPIMGRITVNDLDLINTITDD